MTEAEKKTEEREEEPANGAAEEAAETQAAAPAEESETDKLAPLEAEATELRDQLLRAMAETENLRRRSQREREEAVRYATAPLLRDLLSVADNLERALAHVPEGAAEKDDALKTLLEGMRLTERELQSVLERHHVVKIDPSGERLDPHLHEAMFEIPDTGKPAGTIAQVVQSGYLLHDRLLRPARVGVAKGDSAPQAAAEKAEPGDDERPAGKPGGRLDTSA